MCALRPLAARPARERLPVPAHTVEVDHAERRSGQGDEDARVFAYRVGYAFAADEARAAEVIRVGLVDPGAGLAARGAAVSARHQDVAGRGISCAVLVDDLAGPRVHARCLPD